MCPSFHKLGQTVTVKNVCKGFERCSVLYKLLLWDCFKRHKIRLFFCLQQIKVAVMKWPLSHFVEKKDFSPPMLGMKGDTGEPSSLKNNVFDHLRAIRSRAVTRDLFWTHNQFWETNCGRNVNSHWVLTRTVVLPCSWMHRGGWNSGVLTLLWFWKKHISVRFSLI